MKKFDINSESLQTLVEYGINHLPDDKDRPDMELAKFFSALSSIDYLDDEVKDLVTDAMVYCENESDFPVPSSKEQLEEKYKKL